MAIVPKATALTILNSGYFWRMNFKGLVERFRRDPLDGWLLIQHKTARRRKLP
jgi:hypothetical protein